MAKPSCGWTKAIAYTVEGRQPAGKIFETIRSAQGKTSECGPQARPLAARQLGISPPVRFLRV
jgi:hypothetical protein